MTGTLFPQPIFEGVEKRLELDFAGASGDASGAANAANAAVAPSLRALGREEWSDLLVPAECCIVSSVSNAACDAYLLSESSLFVFDTKIVLKTCGRTRILDAVPGIVSLAQESPRVGCLKLARAKYSRSAFKCPEQQPAPYTHFALEVEALDELFGHLEGGGHAYVLGDQLNKSLWHIYTAGRSPPNSNPPASSCSHLKKSGGNLTLEICMTGLDAKYCEHFSTCGERSTASNEGLRIRSGIAKLIGAQDAVDDYVFDPCGYSMNSVKANSLVTIHITPEENCSYASVEFCGVPLPAEDEAGEKSDPDPDVEIVQPWGELSHVVKSVADLFKPESLYVAATCEGGRSGNVSGAVWEILPRDATTFKKMFSAEQALACYGGTCGFHAFSSSCKDGKAKKAAAATEKLNISTSSGSQSLSLRAPPSPVTVLGGEGEKFGEISLSDASFTSSDASASSGSEDESPASFDAAAATGPAGTCLVAKGVRADTLDTTASVQAYASRKIKMLQLEDTFYVFDLGNVYRRLKTWRTLLPRVRPFYAVKCNPDVGILSTLAALGTGFDCASQVELQSVLSLGVDPSRDVVYANACKRPAYLRHMQRTGTGLTTFDSISELCKIKSYHPGASVVLRIRADDPNARCYLGNKYGAEMDEVRGLLQKAQELELRTVGVSFHVGSGASDPQAFGMAIALARRVFDEAHDLGIRSMSVLDIGGGFAGGTGDGMDQLLEASKVINAALDAHFSCSSDNGAPCCGEGVQNLRIIAEPGRYFSESACTLYSYVFGKRERGERKEYFLTDGIYGSFNNLLYDHATLTAKPLLCASNPCSCSSDNGAGSMAPLHPSTLFGPTCDGLDTVMKDVQLPNMENGDWVSFPSMGAYTISASSNFNGIISDNPKIFYVFSKQE